MGDEFDVMARKIVVGPRLGRLDEISRDLADRVAVALRAVHNAAIEAAAEVAELASADELFRVPATIRALKRETR